jgi:hypothetical protein
MVARIAITVAVWVVGVLFLLTDGQHFTHGLVIVGCGVFGCLPWVPLLPRRHSARRRIAAIVVLGLSAAVIVRVSLHLPAAYDAQRQFNEHAATPGHALQSDGALRLR